MCVEQDAISHRLSIKRGIDKKTNFVEIVAVIGETRSTSCTERG